MRGARDSGGQIVEHLPLSERVGIVKDLDAAVAAAVAAGARATCAQPPISALRPAA